MLDCENEVYTKIATALRNDFAGIDITGVYVNAPSAFPHVNITQIDNLTVKANTTNTYEMAEVVFEVNVYSNKRSEKKSECKQIMNVIDGIFFGMNFRRMSLTPVPNMEDATIYRLVARYRARTDGKYFYRS